MFSKTQENSCYEKCAEFHIYGDSNHWDFQDFIVYDNDTIWVDHECYNEWCICIDECNPGQCCDKLNGIFN